MQKYGKIIIGDCIIMKNKKGFTLVELIGVILVLSILLLITVPAIIELLSNSKNKKLEELSTILELAAETYVEQNRDLFPKLDNIGAKAFIRVGTLIEKRLVTDNIKGINDESIDNYTIIASTGNDNIITYKYVNIDSDISGYVKDNLILHYDGYHQPDGNIWEDLSGSGNHGDTTTIEASTYKVDSLQLDGVDDGVYLANKVSNLFKDSNTVELTLVFSETSSRDVLFGNHSETNTINYEKHELNNGRIYWNGGNPDLNTSTNFFDKDKKYTISFVYSKVNSTIVIYVNGIKKTEFNKSEFGSYSYNFNNAWIGRDFRTGTTCMKGSLYEVRIYNRSLNDSEIKHNHQLDKNRFDF